MPATGEPSSPPQVTEIYSWASELASESRGFEWIPRWYVWPNAVGQIIRQLTTMNGGLIGLVGFRGVGKSSALLAVLFGNLLLEDRDRRKSAKKENDASRSGHETVLFKWRRRQEKFTSLLNGTHEISLNFRREYGTMVLKELEASNPFLVSEELKKKPELLNVDWAERRIGKSSRSALREAAWLRLLGRMKTILIDTPDYSRTDRRQMTKDLEEIYWLWHQLVFGLSEGRPNIVVAIQKEMFRDHFFFDKMTRIELEPLQPREMVEAYVKRFKATEPFTEDALLTIARMSRGIFRRFLRYITLTLDHWSTRPEPPGPIDTATVKDAIPIDRLVEDMELELVELFPKHSDLRLQAVRLLMHLQESGPTKQSLLGEVLCIEPYAMSRLLTKLELHRYVVRERAGTDKRVSLRTAQSAEEASQSKA